MNSWTEWGTLEKICVGRVEGACYPDFEPGVPFNMVQDSLTVQYQDHWVGYRPEERIKRATWELDNLCTILESECVQVVTTEAFQAEAQADWQRRSTTPCDSATAQTQDKDTRVVKKSSTSVCRPTPQRFDHTLLTPWFRSNFQFCIACPRDILITLGNTILESSTACRCRYFEASFYHDLIMPLWNADERVLWKKAPQPTCADSLYNKSWWAWWRNEDAHFEEWRTKGYKHCLNETEIAFEGADMMRFGKDIFVKKGCTTNNMAIKWLRREFPHLRFHAMHFPTDIGPHIDVNLLPIRPPTAGSEGIVLVNQNYPPLKEEMRIFTENNWKVLFSPLPVTDIVSPVAVCSPNLNMNFLSVNPNCVIIEECELPLYNFLDDLGMDVITTPLRSLNEFGGGVHCVTWDIKRDDKCEDFFPNQDYKAECAKDLEGCFDSRALHPSDLPLSFI